jgi:hypothetical protein
VRQRAGVALARAVRDLVDAELPVAVALAVLDVDLQVVAAGDDSGLTGAGWPALLASASFGQSWDAALYPPLLDAYAAPATPIAAAAAATTASIRRATCLSMFLSPL